MSYNIDFINTTPATHRGEYVTRELCCVEHAAAQFEAEHAHQLGACERDDIGGLIVYTRTGAVVAVYDYELDRAWVV
jgi:hypothetical protein